MVVLVISVIVLASAIGVYFALSTPSTKTTIQTTTSYSSQVSVHFRDDYTIQSTNGPLVIHLDLNASTILAGQTILINIAEYNNLPTSINVTRSGDWRLGGLALDPCGTSFYPFGIAVFQGHYSSNNISNAKSLNLFPANYFCAKTIFSNEWFMFHPMSNYASTSQSSSPIPIRC